ncbi:hypothetical protein MMC07_008122 [Pseudocyphellaria aurata]|nr:hypothetical protein [Pseudocyphellaria aurata]
MFKNFAFSSVPRGPEIRLLLLRLSLTNQGSLATEANQQFAKSRERLKEAEKKANVRNASVEARWELIEAFRNIQKTLRRFEVRAKSMTQDNDDEQLFFQDYFGSGRSEGEDEVMDHSKYPSQTKNLTDQNGNSELKALDDRENYHLEKPTKYENYFHRKNMPPFQRRKRMGRITGNYAPAMESALLENPSVLARSAADDLFDRDFFDTFARGAAHDCNVKPSSQHYRGVQTNSIAKAFKRDFHDASEAETPGRRIRPVAASAIDGDAVQRSDNTVDLFDNLIYHPDGSSDSFNKYFHIKPEPQTLNVRRFFFNQDRGKERRLEKRIVSYTASRSKGARRTMYTSSSAARRQNTYNPRWRDTGGGETAPHPPRTWSPQTHMGLL